MEHSSGSNYQHILSNTFFPKKINMVIRKNLSLLELENAPNQINYMIYECKKIIEHFRKYFSFVSNAISTGGLDGNIYF